MSLGELIKSFCAREHMPIGALAHKVGISETEMQAYADDRRVPKAPIIVAIANNLDIDESMLFSAMENSSTAGDNSSMKIRSDVLFKAEKMVTGTREQDYGSPEQNFAVIAGLWTEYLGIKVSALDVAMMMVLFKVARVKHGGGSGDSYVDIAGYAACGAEIRGCQIQMD